VTKDRAFTFTMRAYSSGTQVVPSSATITIRKPGGAALATPVSGASVTVAGGGDMTYALIAGNTSELGANYIADVAYVVSGTTYDARFLFDVVRTPLLNVVLQADLVFHHPDLTDLLTSGESNAQTYIKQAFEDVCGFIDSRGDRPYLVLNSEQLRRPIEHRALALFFFAKQKTLDDRWGTYAASHESSYQSALAALGPKLVYDFNNSGTADGTDAEGKAGEEGAKNYGLRYRV
jgi:hypothetical protein